MILKFERVDKKLKYLMATVLVYSYGTTAFIYFLNRPVLFEVGLEVYGIYVALLKNLIFMTVLAFPPKYHFS